MRFHFLTRVPGLSGCVAALLALSACGGTVNESSLPGDGYVLRCEKGMLHCIRRAETLCKERGYTVISGQETNKVLGGSTSAYRKLVTHGELQIYCGEHEPAPACSTPAASEGAVYSLSTAPPGAEPAPPPPQTQPPAGGSPVAPASLAAPSRLCVPGATQRCIGAGACDGGQACAADGMSFGPCDCGTSAAQPLVQPAPH